MKKLYECIFIIFFLLANLNGWGQTPNGYLDFGTTPSGTTATTGNTGFGGLRIGTGGGSFTLQNPGQTIGADAELKGIAPNTASINSVGITSAEYSTAATTFTISFEVHLSGGSSGTWYFFAGNGTSFGSAQTGGFTGSESFTGLRWVFGASGAITTNNRANATWNATNITGTPFAQNTAYYVTIIGNNSTSTVNYGAASAYSVASNKYDLWVNGSLVGNEVGKAQLATSTTINAFRFYGESSTGNVAAIGLDNIRWYNSCVLPPTHLTLVSVPTTGTVSTNIASYTAEVHSGSATGPIANLFTGAITVAKISGSGAISGTLNPTAVAGVATYANTQFDAAGTYTINATAAVPVVDAATSGNIVISSAGGAPSITSSLTASGTYGSAISTYTITATNTPTSYNATSLPPGLSVNTSTGDITGTPTQAGSFNVSISATNGGGTDTKTLVFTIAQKALTITGLTGSNKTYDGNTTASVTGSAALSGVLPADVSNVTLGGSPSFAFATSSVGTAKAITASGYTISGSASANYSLSQPTGLTANITVATLTVAGAVASNKVYDGTTTATISSLGTLSGVIGADVVSISSTGTFASAGVASGIGVTLVLTGAAAGNYILTQPGITANITQASQTITFGAIPSKIPTSSDFNPGATASSGLTVTYTSSDPLVATIVSGNIHIVGVGTCTITASQTGDANYAAAADVNQTLTVAIACATDLIFSEYVEGSSNNKYLEIYNGTGVSVDLSAYEILLYANGSASATSTLALSGSLANGAVYTIGNSSGSLYTPNLSNTTVMAFNGDDAVSLRKNGTTLVDVIGQIGTDPGTQWGSGLTSTLDHSLRRKVTVTDGDTNGSNTFDPSVEWDGFAIDTYAGLGSHSMNCCSKPTAQAGFTSITNVGASQFDINFSAGTGGTGRIVVVKQGSAITGSPVSGTSYTTGVSSDFSVSTSTIATGEKVVYIGTGTSVTVTGLTGNTAYYVKIFEYNGTDCYLTTTVSNTGNTTTICNTPSTAASNISNSSVGVATASLTWTNGTGSNRLVVLNAGSAVTGTPVDGTAYSANSSYSASPAFTPGTGKIVYNSTSNSVSLTNLAGNTTYYVKIFEFNSVSNCYISTGPTYNFTTNAAITDIITAGGEAACISSMSTGTIALSTDGTQAWQFTVREGGASGDADVLPTIITDLTITQGVSNTVSDWTNIQDAALFDGTTLVAHGTPGTSNIVFSGMSFSTTDNTSKTLTLMVTLKTTLTPSATIDNKVFRFSITNANVTVAVSGSSGYLSSAPVATTLVATNAICITATQLTFTQQPITSAVNEAMAASVTVAGTDANGNTDVDFTSVIRLTSSGTMTGNPLTATAVSGVATFSSVIHTATGTGLTLTAVRNATNDWTLVSNTFNILLSTAFDQGDFAIIAAATQYVNSGNSYDEFSFVTFKDILPGTTFYMTDNGYERLTAGKWANSEGVVKFQRGVSASTITAGSVITIRGTGTTTYSIFICGVNDNANWVLNGNVLGIGAGLDLNVSDQIWVMQGGVWTSGILGDHDATYTGGNVLYGWTGIPWKTTPGYDDTKGSTLFPGNACFSTNVNITSTPTRVKYTGPSTVTSKFGWIARINNVANWTSYSDSVTFHNNSPTYGGLNGIPSVCSFPLAAATEIEGRWTGASNTDWFDCSNWDTRTIPDSNTNVTFSGLATYDPVVDKTSANAALYYSYARSLNLTITDKILSTAASGDSIKVFGNVSIASGSGLNMINGGTFILNGTWTNTGGTFTSGTGTVRYNSSSSQTIAPENYYNLISQSTGSRTLSSTGTIGVAGTFTPGGSVYTITGSTVDFNGSSAAQNIPGFSFYNVGFKNGGTKTLAGSDTIYKALTIGNSATVSDGTVLALSDFDITLHSDNDNTANVSQTAVPLNNVTYGNGRFIVERYLPMQTPYSGRRWRLMGVPVSNINAPSINAAWQEGAVPTSFTADITASTNPHPGYGTHITNGLGGSNNINGFDAGSTANSSIYKMEPGSGAWTIPSSTGITITDYNAYMLFVRGDRSIQVASQYINTTGNANLRIVGKINVGDVTKSTTLGKQVISNPYPSAISMNSVTYNGVPFNSVGTNTFYMWDPKLLGSKGVGAWVTFQSTGNSSSFTGVPNPVDSTYMSVFGTSGKIESGGAFYMNTTSSLIFHESNKLTTSSTNGLASRPSGVQNAAVNIAELYTNLAYLDALGNPVLADGVATTYSDEYHNDVDNEDALKFQSFQTKEKIGLLRNDSLLVIERRKTIAVSDTIFLQILKLDNNYKYQLQFKGSNFAPELTAYLADKYLDSNFVISTDGITRHNFNTNSDPASLDMNRFKVIFKLKDFGPLPVTLTSVSAIQKNNNIQVDWEIQGEENMLQYDVEKSADGINFTEVATVQSDMETLYSWTDRNVINGLNYYRIKIIGNTGEYTYSQIVKVNTTSGLASVSVYNNVIKDGIFDLLFVNEPKGAYQVRLYNSAGQKLLDKSIEHTSGTASVRLEVGQHLAQGIYHVEITMPDNSRSVIKVIRK